MNLKEAEEVKRVCESRRVDGLIKFDPSGRFCDRNYCCAITFLEAIKSIQPLVQALESISQSGCIYCESPEKALSVLSYWLNLQRE